MFTTHSPDPRPDWHDASAETGLAWHPAIRAVDWVIRWSLVAFETAIVWEFLTQHTVNLFMRPALTFALAGLILAGLGMFLVLELIFEFWWANVRHMLDQYPRRFARRVNSVTSVSFVVVAATMVWLFRWVLGLMRQFLYAWAIRVSPPGRMNDGLPTLNRPLKLLLLACSIGLFWRMFRGVLPTARRYATAARCLGMRLMLKGMLSMTLFRLRQPRREFFVQAPLISDIPWWAICALLQVGLKGTVFAWALPVPLLGVSVEYALAKVAPAVWLYLGASKLDSFRVFTHLRHAWFWYNAVTLLDRESDAGQSAYYNEAEHMWKQSALGKAFRNPHAARLWSLRTRPPLWAQTVKTLIDLVKVVVVDVRTGSEPVRYELAWLAQPGRIEKTWLLATDDRRAPALATGPDDDRQCLFPPERLVTEEMLYTATWAPDGLRIGHPTQA
jgi:hypothetical protein